MSARSGATVATSQGTSGRPLRMGGVRTRLGVMGGTFDPIHYGHLVTAEEALHQFQLDEVLFVPTGRPWMKEHEQVSPPEDRYLMTVIATASNPLFGVSRIEVDRDGPTYTVDTLRELRGERGGDADLFFVTGADAVLEIVQRWKQADDLFDLAHFIAATRPGFDLEDFETHAPTKHPGITVMNVPALAISSTDVRSRVRAGRPIRYLVPEGVKSYVEKAGLYR
jgi:nicotinate-nucleotide adenylyltransferase